MLLDEIGNESKQSNHAVSEFKALYKARVNMGKPTILISNYGFEEFQKKYGKSIATMVKSHARVLDFTGSGNVRESKCKDEMDQFFKNLK